ncbi:MAG: NPCBM/NEW2 domain-containing protein [Thermoguttaceae bacterium]
MPQFLVPLLLLLFSFSAVPFLPASITVEILDQAGERTTGELVAIDQDKMTVNQSSVLNEIPLDRLNRMIPLQKPQLVQGQSVGLCVELADGSSVQCLQLTTKEETAILELHDKTVLPIPVALLHSVRFMSFPDETPTEKQENDILRREWRRLRPGSLTEDRIIIRTSATTNRGNPTLDYYSGIIGEIRPESVLFELDGERLPVSRNKIFGLYFAGRQPVIDQLSIWRITEINGSSWMLKSIVYDRERQLFRCQTSNGVERTLPLNQLSELLLIAHQSVIPLFDLIPDSIQIQSPLRWSRLEQREENRLEHSWQEFLLAKLQSGSVFAKETVNAPNETLRQEDLSRTTTLLQSSRRTSEERLPQYAVPTLQGIYLNGLRYEKGWTLFPKTELLFTLDEKFVRLSGLAGIDDRLRPDGIVRLKILGDDVELLNVQIRGDEPAQPLQINLQGIKQLTFIVDIADGLQPGTRLNLVNMNLEEHLTADP